MNKEKMARFHSDNILDEADKLFSKYGFEKTTIEMIAKNSQYTKPTIYAYFESKEEIYASNLYRHMLKFKDNFEEILSLDLPAKEIYLKCCHEVLNFKENHMVYFMGIIGNVDYKNKQLGADSAFAIGELSNTINSKVCKVFDKATKEGLIPKDTDIAFSYAYIWSCVIGLITSFKFDKSNFKSLEEYENTMDKCFLMVVEVFFNANK